MIFGLGASVGVMLGILISIGIAFDAYRYSNKQIEKGYALAWPLKAFLRALMFAVGSSLISALFLAIDMRSGTGIVLEGSAIWVELIILVIWAFLTPAMIFAASGWVLVVIWLTLATRDRIKRV